MPSSMRTFSVERGVNQPLFAGNGWNNGGSYARMGRDDGGGHQSGGILGWWHGLPHAKKQLIKWGSAAGALIVVIIAISVSVSSSKSSNGGGGGSSQPSGPTPPVSDASQGAPGTGDASTGGGGGAAISPPPPPSPLPTADLIVNQPSQPPPPPPDAPPPPPPPAPAPPSEAPSPETVVVPPETSTTETNTTTDPTANATLADACNWNSLYLPAGLAQPVQYNLQLTAYVQPVADATASPLWDAQLNNTAQGQLQTQVQVLQDTTCLVLHAGPSMTISRVTWSTADTTVMPVPASTSFNEALQQLTLRFEQPLTAGSEGYLNFLFNYTIQEALDGFYLSTYKVGNVNHTVASTQFQSIAARKAFPCWDEPQYKANFSLALTTHPSSIVLSNMPAQSETTSPEGLKRTEFQVSPPMSTYLMAWVAGEFSPVFKRCQTNSTRPPVNVTVWATPSKAHLIGDTPDVACNAMTQFEQALGVPFPLPKLDLVGIPDFSSEAMENWGLITFRESSLLINGTNQQGIKEILDVARTIAHEISHQWFGNLVTCKDWNDVWLNEGFATYFENVGGDYFPNIDGDLQDKEGLLQYFFFPEITAPALLADSISSTHPLASRTHLTDLAQADNLFDDITYKKGAALLRMLRAYLTLVVGQGGALRADAPSFPPIETTNSLSLPAPTTNPAALPDIVGSKNLTFVPLRRLASARRMLQDPIADATLDSTLEDSSTPGGEESSSGLMELSPAGESSDTGAVGSDSAEQSSYDDYTDLPVQDGNVTPGSGSVLDTFAVPNYLTDPFLWALNKYLTTYQYKSVTTDDLWNSLSNSTGLPISSWMEAWTYQASYPVVQVTSVTRGDGQVALTLRQRPMLAGGQCGPSTAEAPNNRQWWIPFLVAPAALTPQRVQAATMDACEASLTVPMPVDETADPGVTMLLNFGRHGLFHVNYTDTQWQRITSHADVKHIASQNMAGLLSDSYRLTEIGDVGQVLSLQPFLNLTKSMEARNESYYAAWSVFTNKLVRMQRLLSVAAVTLPVTTDPTTGTTTADWGTCYDNYRAWVNQVYDQFYDAVGFDMAANEADNGLLSQSARRRLARPLILDAAGRAGAQTVLNYAIPLMKGLAPGQAWQETGPERLHPDVREVVACLYVRGNLSDLAIWHEYSPATAYDFVKALYAQEAHPLDQARLLHALTCTERPEKVQDFLDYIINPFQDVQLQDVPTALKSLALGGGAAFKATWEAVLATDGDYMAKLVKRWPEPSAAAYGLGRALKDMAAWFVSTNYDAAMQGFYERNRALLDPTFLKLYQEHTQRNMAWLSTAGSQLCSYVADQVAHAASPPP